MILSALTVIYGHVKGTSRTTWRISSSHRRSVNFRLFTFLPNANHAYLPPPPQIKYGVLYLMFMGACIVIIWYVIPTRCTSHRSTRHLQHTQISSNFSTIAADNSTGTYIVHYSIELIAHSAEYTLFNNCNFNLVYRHFLSVNLTLSITV
jgi:hypothetical protein